MDQTLAWAWSLYLIPFQSAHTASLINQSLTLSAPTPFSSRSNHVKSPFQQPCKGKPKPKTQQVRPSPFHPTTIAAFRNTVRSLAEVQMLQFFTIMTRWHAIHAAICYLLAVLLVGCMLSTAAYGREKSLRIRQRRIGIEEIEEKPETGESTYEELGTSERRVYGINVLDLEDCCVAM